MKKFSLITLTVFVGFLNLCLAEPKTFICEYTYQASDYDSRLTCQAIAIE